MAPGLGVGGATSIKESVKWQMVALRRCSAGNFSTRSSDRATHRGEWSSDTTTDAATGGYRTWAVTSVDATRTNLSVATAMLESCFNRSSFFSYDRPYCLTLVVFY